MNHSNPSSLPREPEKPKFKGLFISAYIITTLLIIGIFISLFLLFKELRLNRQLESLERDKQMQQLLTADSLAADSLMQQDQDLTLDDLRSYENSVADLQNIINETTYSSIQLRMDNSTSFGMRVQNILNDLQQNSNAKVEEIKATHKSFVASLENVDDYHRITATQEYYITHDHATDLLAALKLYRTNVILSLNTIAITDTDEIENELPLDDHPMAAMTDQWDLIQFEGNPEGAKEYLQLLETQIRAFEYAVLNRISTEIK